MLLVGILPLGSLFIPVSHLVNQTCPKLHTACDTSGLLGTAFYPIASYIWLKVCENISLMSNLKKNAKKGHLMPTKCQTNLK